MTVFHKIEKSYRNDCVPPIYLTVWKWLCPTKLRKVLEMTVFHLIIKWYGIKEKSKTFVHYENKYITYIKHKQNCIAPYTEINPLLLKLLPYLELTVLHNI